MGETTEIAWCDATFNAWIGCHKVSPGCKHCYAEVDTFARVRRGRGLELWGADAHRHVTSDEYWRKPLVWNKAALAEGVRRRVFCSSLSDVFEDRADLVLPRVRLAMLVAATPGLDWLFLTKRPENAARLWESATSEALGRSLIGYPEVADVYAQHGAWLPNIWLGASVEDQEYADERIPRLLATHATVRFLSCEPLLGPLSLFDAGCPHPIQTPFGVDLPPGAIDWVIVGGESGPDPRPCALEWVEGIVEQCRGAKVSCFVKQLGNHVVSETRVDDGRWAWRAGLQHPKGGDPSEWPVELRVRQFPTVRT